MKKRTLQFVSLLSICAATAGWLYESSAIETKPATDSPTLPTASTATLAPQDSLKIRETGRGDDFNLVKAEGVTVQEFVDGAGKKLTNQQIIARHQHPSFDRLTTDAFKMTNPTAFDFSVGDHLIKMGFANFTPQQFSATRFLMQAPAPTAEQIAAAEYLMRTNPAVIETPNAPTQEQIDAACYLMTAKPCVIGKATVPTKNQLAATVRLQDIPFNIDKPTEKEINVGDHLLSIGFKDFNPQQFAATYYLMNVLEPVKTKPTKEDIAATVAIQGTPFNKIAPTIKDIDIAKRLFASGNLFFTPQQFAAADYLISNPQQGIKSPTVAQLDATTLLQTPQNGDATIATPGGTEINIVASGSSPEVQKALAWGLQHNFNQQNPETQLGGIARVIPTADGTPDVHDFQVIWTAPGHQGYSFNEEETRHGRGITFRVSNDRLPEGAFPKLGPNALVVFTDITADPDDHTKVMFKNGAQQP
jgi:hypothetical protein